MNYPIAKKQARVFKEFNNQRIDDYYWLNQRDNQQVIDYLEAENKYTDEALSDTVELQETLFNEIKSRFKQDESTLPFYNNSWYYYSRHEEGKEYPVYCRKKSLESEEHIMLDGNKMAEGLA